MLARPLTLGAMSDLAWNGLRQRGRDATPSTILGLASMLAVASGISVTGGSYTQDWTAVVRPSLMTFPTITVTFLASNLYGFLLIICGGWTAVRLRGRRPRVGPGGDEDVTLRWCPGDTRRCAAGPGDDRHQVR